MAALITPSLTAGFCPLRLFGQAAAGRAEEGVRDRHHLVNAVSFSFSPNTGKLLENLVYLALQRRTREVYCYTSPGGFEVDFYLPETRELIQVSRDRAQPATRERETRSLMDALRGLSLTRGLILTDANASAIESGGLTVEVQSVAEWLLEP